MLSTYVAYQGRDHEITWTHNASIDNLDIYGTRLCLGGRSSNRYHRRYELTLTLTENIGCADQRRHCSDHRPLSIIEATPPYHLITIWIFMKDWRAEGVIVSAQLSQTPHEYNSNNHVGFTQQSTTNHNKEHYHAAKYNSYITILIV